MRAAGRVAGEEAGGHQIQIVAEKGGENKRGKEASQGERRGAEEERGRRRVGGECGRL